MEVIPKLVEGSMARYVTGSGQTQATTDRVHIYETEGNIAPLSRGRRLQSGDGSKMVSVDRCRKRRRETNDYGLQYDVPFPQILDEGPDDDIFSALTTVLSAAESVCYSEGAASLLTLWPKLENKSKNNNNR